MTVVAEVPNDTSKIFFGAWLTLEDDDGQSVKYRLVGPDEIDPARGYISIDAPLGRALLGKKIDSEVEIESPTGRKRYYVLAIDY